jgi:plastocyanin
MPLKNLGVRAAAGAALVLLAAACGGGEAERPPAPPDAKRVDSARTGSIAGRIAFEGPPPENPRVKLAGDPACQREHPDGVTLETVLVNNGGLDNAFVYVKEGLSGYYFEAPTEQVKLDQKECRYTPHVFGARVGQPIEISNSDPTLHNVHAVANVNRDFNFPQAIQGMKNTRTFTAPEVMVHFKCDVHNWMSAYAGVLPHPYFAVTANGGAFELRNLPAGTYTIEAWHEKLGTQTANVTLAEKESKTLNLTFVLK